MITLVEEDIAKLKYEIAYTQQRQRQESLNFNRLVKFFRSTNFSKFKVRDNSLIR